MLEKILTTLYLTSTLAIAPIRAEQIKHDYNGLIIPEFVSGEIIKEQSGIEVLDKHGRFALDFFGVVYTLKTDTSDISLVSAQDIFDRGDHISVRIRHSGLEIFDKANQKRQGKDLYSIVELYENRLS